MSKCKIEFGEVKLNETSLREVMDCLSKNRITMGEKVERFEEQWGNLFGYKYNVCVNSGTSADFCALLALYDFGAQPGDEVILPGCCFIACAEAVAAAGFTPVWVDVDFRTQNIDVEKIYDSATEKTVAVLAVNNMGKPCNMEEIRNICNTNNWVYIADNAEGHGCTYKGGHAGYWADMATYSFYAAHLIFGGELGMVSTNRKDLYDILRSIRTHGRKNGDLYFNHERMGWNAKPTDLGAAIALGGVEDFWEIFNKRKRNLNYLISRLAGNDWVFFNQEDEFDVTCPHAFSITPKSFYPNIDYFNKFVGMLNNAGIHWKRNFGRTVDHGAFKTYKSSYDNPIGNRLPNSQHIGHYGIHVACHQFLTQEDLDYMVEVFKNSLYLLRGKN